MKEFIRLNTGDAARRPVCEEDGAAGAALRCHPRLDAGGGRRPCWMTSPRLPRFRWIRRWMKPGTAPSGRASRCRRRWRTRRGARRCRTGCGWRGCWSRRAAAVTGSARRSSRAFLIHNSGQNAVVFRTRTWHQSGGHKARDAKGAEITIQFDRLDEIAWLVPFRLAPGEFVEVEAAGIGVGANKNDEDWHGTRSARGSRRRRVTR